MVIHFFHGRNNPDEILEDWGSSGPFVDIGGIGCTYKMIKLFPRNFESFHNVKFDDDLIPIDNKFYADFEVFQDDDGHLNEGISNGLKIMSFEEFKQLNRI